MNIDNTFGRLIKIIFPILLLTGLTGCEDKEYLSESIAINAVEAYLKSNPIYEAANMQIGEVKFKLKKDENKLHAYKNLAGKGYIDFKLSKKKKKFLSKDSVFVYEVKLTDKARPFILKQKKEKVTVKSFDYQLDGKEKARIELSGKRSGKVVLTLKKTDTDFASLAEDRNPHSSFITQTFTLRYKKDKGWIVTKSK
jgi:hypothetical protein